MTRRLVATGWCLPLVPLFAALLHVAASRVPGLESPPAQLLTLAALACAASAGGGMHRPRLAALAVGLIALLAGVAAGGSAGLVTAAICVASAAGVAACVSWMLRDMPDLRVSRGWLAVWIAVMFVTALRISTLGAFIADPTHTVGSIAPDLPTATRHSCLTSYLHGCALAESGADPYDPKYDPPDLDLDRPLPPTAQQFAPFTLDMFGYSPAFLVFIRGLKVLAPDFLAMRALFPFLSLGLWTWSLWWTGRHLGGVAEVRLLWFAPLVAASTPMHLSLQFGNASVLLAAVCTLAWLGVKRGWPGSAGVLIAFATLTRYMPALLALIVIARRRWRVMLGGIAGTVGFVGASILLFGLSPWRDFVHTLLPLMAHSDVMGFLDDTPAQIAINVSPFSIPFKLAALGLGDMGWDEARLVNRVFTGLLLILTVLAARPEADDRYDLLRWSSIATLGAVASNFAGPHVQVGTAFVLLVLVAEVRGAVGWALFAAGWALFLVFPLPVSDSLLLVLGLTQTIALLGLLCWLVIRRAPTVPTADPT